jgi:hypothetical protein
VQEPGGIRRFADVAACVVAALVLVGLSASAVHAADTFEIAGEVDGLYPGADTTLDARVTNPHPFGIRVISTTVTVFDASLGCPASMLEIDDSQATAEVPAGGTGTVPLDVRMSRGAPDACQGATWPLAFAGTAVGTPTIGLPGTSMLGPQSPVVLAAIGAVLLVGALIAGGRDRRRRRPRAP